MLRIIKVALIICFLPLILIRRQLIVTVQLHHPITNQHRLLITVRLLQTMVVIIQVIVVVIIRVVATMEVGQVTPAEDIRIVPVAEDIVPEAMGIQEAMAEDAGTNICLNHLPIIKVSFSI